MRGRLCVWIASVAFLMAAATLFATPTYAQARVKTPSSVETKVQQLTELASKKPIIRFNGNKFRDYVKSAPRNYSVVVIFTAMAPSRQCSICRHVHDEFTIVANSFRYSQAYSNQLFFAMVDFDEGSDIFQALRLNTAPVIMHFPSKGKPKPTDTIDFQRVGVSAEAIAKWIQERTDIQIRVFRPPNYSGTVAVVMLILLCGGFFYLRRNNLDFLYNKQMWAVGAIVFCFIMVSGQMWNQIRGPPFVHRAQNGGVSYIHGSSQGQFVLETYIIMGLNAAIVGGMILLAESGGGFKVEGSPAPVKEKNAGSNVDYRKRRLLAFFGLALVCIFFSLLLSVFRTKAQGYPYSFLFK
ncbi:oligosaccharide transferase gamma subunit [Arctopsyche grandis]|uniref:oligosaccharide transferase gamma subunit n=1 Tax=Arctopsyche grandis TaxID=121162 RepID=UPI00406D9BEA